MPGEEKLESWREAIARRWLFMRSRKAPGSRVAFAEALQRATGFEISPYMIEKVEHDRSFPGFEQILAYRDYFECDFNYLLAEEVVRAPGYPDFLSHPEILEFCDTMRAAGRTEDEMIGQLCEAAVLLTGMAYLFHPELKPRGLALKAGRPKPKKPRR